MSIRSERLFDLQQLDMEIDAKTEELTRVESQLGETEELISAREAIQIERGRRGQLEKDQRSLEWEVEDLSAKIAPLEEKLYSGRVKIPKELTGLQQEVEGLKARRRKAEDRQLDIMTALDDSLPDLRQMEADLSRVEAAWRAEQASLAEEQRRLKGEIGSATAKKEDLLKLIPPSDQVLYIELRETKRGRAVARIERGMCQGCRITLPSIEIQRARASSAPSRCSSCGRIVIAG